MTGTPPGEEHGEHARFGTTNNLVLHEGVERGRTRRIRDLVQKPVIRQWVQGGKLYRETSPRESPRIELFFDLLYVGVIHQLAEAAIEDGATGPSVARFVLTFWPSWSVWEEARRFSNQSGTDDLLHRTWILIGMICILGYSVNASAIPIHPGDVVADPKAEESGGESAAGAAEAGTAEHAVRWLLRRAAETVHGAAEASSAGTAHHGGNQPVRAAAAFWLIIKFTRVVVLILYAWELPEFRVAQLLNAAAVAIPMFAYLPLIWVTSRRAQIGLAITGIVLDLMRIDMILFNVYGRWTQIKRRNEIRRQIRAGEIDAATAPDTAIHFTRMAPLPANLRIPAINIEHAVERSGAFTVIVLGELVMNLLYVATPGNFGASPVFGRSVLGLMVAWAINYIYTLPSDTHIIKYEHALRRTWFTGILFNFFHWPLCASILLASAAAGKMTTENDIEDDPRNIGIKWFWGCGLGFALLFLACLDMLHANLDPWNAARIPRPIRFCVALVGSLALMLFPLSSEHLTSTEMMGIAAAITWFVLAVYLLGSIPKRSAVLDPEADSETEPAVTVTDLRRSESHKSLRSHRSFHSHHGEPSRAHDDDDDGTNFGDRMAIAANT